MTQQKFEMSKETRQVDTTTARISFDTGHWALGSAMREVSCQGDVKVKVPGNPEGLSFCPKKFILQLWAAQNCPLSNQILVTPSTKGFQVWIRHTAPPK